MDLGIIEIPAYVYVISRLTFTATGNIFRADGSRPDCFCINRAEAAAIKTDINTSMYKMLDRHPEETWIDAEGNHNHAIDFCVIDQIFRNPNG
jgi:hypothetical protein